MSVTIFGAGSNFRGSHARSWPQEAQSRHHMLGGGAWSWFSNLFEAKVRDGVVLHDGVAVYRCGLASHLSSVFLKVQTWTWCRDQEGLFESQQSYIYSGVICRVLDTTWPPSVHVCTLVCTVHTARRSSTILTCRACHQPSLRAHEDVGARGFSGRLHETL